jgi:hypothetical protein
MPHELQLTHTLSNSANLGRIAGVHEDNVAADIGLRIARAEPQDGTFDFMLFGNAVQSDDLNVSGYSRQTENEIFAAVEECRNEWKTNVVDRTVQVQVGAKKKFELPFQDRWDLAGEPGHLAEAVPKLALAGHKLFRLIFELNGDDNLRAVAEKLRTLLAAGPRSIAITSGGVSALGHALHASDSGREAPYRRVELEKGGLLGLSAYPAAEPGEYRDRQRNPSE